MTEVFGLPIQPLPEGWQPLEACVVVKLLDGKGAVALATRYTDSLNLWEALGMTVASADGLRDEIKNGFESREQP